MGGFGHTRFREVLLGGVNETLLRSMTLPVLMSHQESSMYKKILVPTDGSELSQQAVDAAIDFAHCCGSELVAISVAEPYPLLPGIEGAMTIDPGIESRVLRDLAQHNVDQVANAAAVAGVPCQTTIAMSFNPHEEIIHAAEENGCDVIFMASHGRRGLSRLLAGSVTQKVLAYATVPVMVLRPQPAAGTGRAAPATQGVAARQA
jgi:nucleotide-binding universal stress UspA family protein